MNILVLSDKLHPTPNANGLCLINIVREMERMGHSLWNVDRVDTICLEDKSERTICFFGKNILSWAACNNIKERLFYIVKKIFSFLAYPRYNRTIVRRYVAEGLALMEINKFDLILCVCNPVETVESALMLKKKHPSVKLVVYNLDTVSDIPLPKLEQKIEHYFRLKAYRWERRVFSQSDAIVNLKCHKAHFSSDKYSLYSQKMLYQDVPLLIKQHYRKSPSQNEKNNIQLVYAGAFYRQMREPELLLSLFDGLSLDGVRDYSLLILTSPGYCREIDSKTDNTHILTHEYLSGKAFDEVMETSDVLVSLGNKESIMFPSKIVSYMALGKPIIHIYQDDKDSVIEYLRNYPDKLLVDYRAGIGLNKKIIFDYLNMEHTPVDVNELYELYRESTPEYNANQILERLEGRV